MATTNHGLYVFEDEQTELTFKEFRQQLAGTAETSNMQKIDALFEECIALIQAAEEYTNTTITDAIDTFKTENDKLIKQDGESILVGGTENGAPINFNDGTQISTLAGGQFVVGGVKVNEVRIKDYLIKQNTRNGHLQFSYKPEIIMEAE